MLLTFTVINESQGKNTDLEKEKMSFSFSKSVFYFEQCSVQKANVSKIGHLDNKNFQTCYDQPLSLDS